MTLVMWVGFILASYSVVGNDVIQTLGTFLTSNEKKVKWYILWAFASSIMVYALVAGYINNDIDYGRLDKFDLNAVSYNWYYILPPLVLLLITRSGIPVSTTFMVLTLFSLNKIPSDIGSMVSSVFDVDAKLGGMIQKSIMGYVIAFTSAIVIYVLITRLTEKKFIETPVKDKARPYWVVAQWLITAFLWFQWLTQDLANIYVYLKGGEGLSTGGFIFSLVILVGLLGYIFYQAGGKVQDVVREKTSTADIRSATFIDLIYGIILYIFKYNYLDLFEAKLPMSTTWVFIGLLAGREIGIRLNLEKKLTKATTRMVFADLGKVFFGLLVSVILVFIIKLIGG
ncbi:MAG: hypothetical protein ACPG19_14030, partial [Saprospiraceae bacterium]